MRESLTDSHGRAATTPALGEQAAPLFLSEEGNNFRAQWDRSENASTGDLRLALRRYRCFFGRLLWA